MQFTAWQTACPRPHEMVLWPGITNNEKYARIVCERVLPALKDFAESTAAKDDNFVDYGRVLNFPGYPSEPYSLPNIDKKLADVSADPELIEDLKETFMVLFKDYPKYICERPITLRRGANTGLPEFTRDTIAKTEALDYTFDHIEEVISLILSDNWDRLRSDFGFHPVVSLGSRTQTDSIVIDWHGYLFEAIPKKRDAIISWDPITNEQQRVDIDKTLQRYGIKYPVYAMRHRTIYAIPVRFTALLMPVGNAMFDSAVPRFPFTFEPGDIYEFIRRQDVQAKIMNRLLLSLDFHEFDHSVITELLALFCALMRKVGVADWAAKLAFDVTHLPCIMNGLYSDGRDAPPHILGNLGGWYQTLHQIAFGLPSGWVFTALFPKWFVTTLFYHVLWKWCKVIPHDIKEYVAMLEWRDSSPVFDMCGGDDNCLVINPSVYETVRDKFCEGVTRAVPTMKVEWDAAPQFLSHRFAKDGNGRWTAKPDAVRGFCNSFCPAETAYPSVYREAKPSYNVEKLSHWYGVTGDASPEQVKASTKVPAFGFFQKMDLYQKRLPSWASLWDGVFAELEKLNPNLRSNMRQICDIEETFLSRLHVVATNAADLDVLASPDKAVYRYRQDQISSSVYNLTYLSYGEERLRKLKPLYLQAA